MAVKAKFEAPLQVVETREMRDRIVAIAEREEISQAQVIREILAAGIEAREAESAGLTNDTC
jgi:predicted DNA-binding protein